MVRMGYYTVNDVIAELGISKNTLYNWERAGKIPAARRHPMNKYRVYDKKDIEKIRKMIKA